MRKNEIYKVTFVGFIVNLLLSVGKIAAGFFGKSSAMIADGVHSISDFFTDIIVISFVNVSSKPHDENHRYGHGKYETLASIIIAISLFIIAVGIIYNSSVLIYDTIFNGLVLEKPHLIALMAACVSIISKEWLFWYTYIVGKRIDSSAVIANAWHHRSDAFSSLGTLLGISGAYFLGDSWRILDPVAALIVGGFIIKVAINLMKPNLDELMEKSLPHDIEKVIIDTILESKELSDIHNFKTRKIGNNYAIEVHVRINPKATVEESHIISHTIKDKLITRFGEGTQFIIHFEPKKDSNNNQCC